MSTQYLIYDPEEDVYVRRCLFNKENLCEIDWTSEKDSGYIDPQAFYEMMCQAGWEVYARIHVSGGKVVTLPIYKLDDICKWWFIPFTDEEEYETGPDHMSGVLCGDWFMSLEGEQG